MSCSLTYEEFVELYRPINNQFTKDGAYNRTLFGLSNHEFRKVYTFDKQNVWSLLNYAIVPGLHEEAEGYFVTQRQWSSDKIEVIL